MFHQFRAASLIVSHRVVMLLALFASYMLLTVAAAEEVIAENPLYVDPATRDFTENPALLERIQSGPHGYFRFINIEFSDEVCRRFSESLAGTPSFNLHGDAHIEQYAITDIGRGLTDFDDSSMGPAVIDLMRFGVSLRLTCRALDWEAYTTVMYDQFLQGYRDALNEPDMNPPEPDLVQRIRSTFTIDRVNYFKWVDSIMEPMPDEEKDSLETAFQPYIETMRAENPEYDPSYFDVAQMGYLRMGIGSALDIKFLVRIQGATADSLDDVVLEMKEVRDLSAIDCLTSTQAGDPFRVLLGQARIAYQPFSHLGYFRYLDKNFWVHSWVDNYKELDIDKTFQSLDDLAAVVYDVGAQLGLGHTKHIAAPLDLQLRREQLQLLDRDEEKIKATCVELEANVVDAWQQFCAKKQSN